MLPNFPDYIGSLQIRNKKPITPTYNEEKPTDMKEISYNGRTGVINLHLRYMYTCAHEFKVDLKFTHVFQGQDWISCLKVVRHFRVLTEVYRSMIMNQSYLRTGVFQGEMN